MAPNYYPELDKCFEIGVSYICDRIWPIIEQAGDNEKKLRMIRKVIDGFYNASLGTHIPSEVKPVIRGMKASMAKVERRAG